METEKSLLPDIAGLATFNEASQAVIGYLREHVDVGMWMATRVADNHQTLLTGKAEFYGLEPGMSLQWNETVCSRMVAGDGPNIALDVSQVPEYAESPLLQAVP